MIRTFYFEYFELTFWIAALICLAISDPTEPHYTLCPLKLSGFTWCPGCGLGHSISFLFHGDIVKSFHAHWLGIPAVIIIARRVMILIKINLSPYIFKAHKTDESPLTNS